LNFIDFDNEKFIGRDALLKIKGQQPDKRLLGLVLTEPGVPRHGCPVTSGGREVGTVTSGNFSPSLHKGIAMAYIPAAGVTDAAVVIRGKAHAAEAFELPFYRKK
jgi:glycine cleavage system T protein (aminomethyltransferase)